MSQIEVIAVPAFSDNYIWLVAADNNACAVVDPGDAGPVRRELKRRGLKLEYILITHHHPDHTGGMAALQAEMGARVFGPHDPRIPGQTRSFRHGEQVSLPELGMTFDVIEVPGHTSTHIAFYGDGRLFCGDTLFSVGCGRLFEGTPEQMQASLDAIVETAAPDTQVYCAHEYTLSNCRFAIEVEPENADLQARMAEVRKARADDVPTVPSTLEQECRVNPFLRTRQPAVVEAAQNRRPGVRPGAETLAVIRGWKDAF